MNVTMEYLTACLAPLSGLLIGSLLVSFLHISKVASKSGYHPLDREIYISGQLMTERSAEVYLNVVTSFVVMVGGLWIVLATCCSAG
jgi:hypothetical protein